MWHIVANISLSLRVSITLHVTDRLTDRPKKAILKKQGHLLQVDIRIVPKLLTCIVVDLLMC